jgi:N4-gp56 family major capsid protein
VLRKVSRSARQMERGDQAPRGHGRNRGATSPGSSSLVTRLHTYSQPENIWNGEVGTFENFRFIETPRAPVFADAGSSTTLTDVYGTLFLGRQALAKAYSNTDGNGPQPRVVPGPVVDHLRRFVPMGWYHFVGYARFRDASLRRVETASTIGSNA